MNAIKYMALAGLSVALPGCATVINGTSQDFAIASDPDGASASLTDGTSCKTPCKMSRKRREDFRVDFTLDGYDPAYVLVQSRTGGAMAGNILLGGIIGGAVDASNGASNHLHPQPLKVKLARSGAGEEAMLLAKNGTPEKSVKAHNDEVRADVAKSIGAQAAGIAAAPTGTSSTASSPAGASDGQSATDASVSPAASGGEDSAGTRISAPSGL